MPSEAAIVNRLEGLYVPMFQNMFQQSRSDAKQNFAGLIQKAKAASAKNPFAEVDANRLFHLAETDARLSLDMQWKISEGVRKQDFCWWWDMPDLERQFFFQMDFIHIYGYFHALREQGVAADEAARLVKKAQPSFAQLVQLTNSPRDEDTQLPAELRDRVNRRTESEAAKDASGKKWNASRAPFSSFNAFIRYEIREGRV